MAESDWSSIWEDVPPDVKALFEEKLGSRPARRMAARARLVCSSWAASLAFPALRVSIDAPPDAARSRLLAGAKSLSWVRPPRSLAGWGCAKTLRSLSLDYCVYVSDPESRPSSLALGELLLSDDDRPALLERLSVTWCNLRSEELEGIGRLRALRTLELTFASIDDGALRKISCLESLARLDVSCNGRVTDAGLACLPRSLTDLNVCGCELLTDACLAALPTGIASLDLSRCERITDAGLCHLGRVETLKLDYCARVDGSGLAELRDVCSLGVARVGWNTRSFDLGFSLAGLEKLSRMTALDASGIRIEEEISIPTLTSLDHRFGSGLGMLRLPALADLCVYGAKVSALDLMPFGRSLTSLRVDASKTIARGLKELGDCLPALASLGLAVDRDFLDDADYAPIRTHFPALTALDVSGMGVKDSDLAHMGHLSSLDLTSCQFVTAAGLERLAGLSRVRLAGCPGLEDALAVEELLKTVENVEF